jgi:hypothetical protein
MMLKRSLFLLLLLVLIVPATQADTIHLKNGSVLKGKVASFSDDQFIVMIDTGSGRYQSRAMVYVGDVARIEFDGSPSGAAAIDATPRDTTPRDTDTAPTTRPTDTTRDNPAANRPFDRTPADPTKPERTNDSPARVAVAPDIPRTHTSSEPSPKSTSPADPPRDTTPRDTDTSPTIGKEKTTDTVAPDRSPVMPPDKSSVTNPTPTSEQPEPERPTRKPSGPVRTTSVDVVGKRDWTSTGLIVKRGDRLRINASGSVTLDPTSGQNTGPEGLELTDPKKLMPDKPTGALIGVIGADNDDFIFIGRTTEFTATRDGLLFLSVNEGTLADNSGVFKAVIEVLPKK